MRHVRRVALPHFVGSKYFVNYSPEGDSPKIVTSDRYLGAIARDRATRVKMEPWMTCATPRPGSNRYC